MPDSRKVILYISQSLDGYIAAPGDKLDFLSMVEDEGEDYGYGAFMESVDTIITGRRTYEWVVGMVGHYPNAHLDTYVLTRKELPSEGKVQFYNGPLAELVAELKSKPGKHIYCDGGGATVHMMLEERLIDEIVISIIPILLGDGIPLFHAGRPEQPLHLLSATSFPKGLVQVHYEVQH